MIISHTLYCSSMTMASPKEVVQSGAEEPDENMHHQRITEQLQRAQWLRAAILGANDGLLSTTSLMIGIGAAKEDRRTMILSGLAGAFAGSCSMAVGEFVSVSTQRDIERATVMEQHSSPTTTSKKLSGDKLPISASPTTNRPVETRVAVSPALTSIDSPAAMTPGRKLPAGLSPGRSPLMKVITEDAIKTTNTTKVLAGEEDEKGEEALPNPYKAAAASALAFLCGSFVPLLSAAFIVSNTIRIAVIVATTSVALALFGAIGAYLGSSPVRVSAVRVLVGGWMAMAITYGLLKPFDKDDH